MKIGLIAVGLNTYWHQFGGLRERLDGYRNAIKEKMEAYGGQIVADAGMVDDVDKAHAAAALFRRDEAEVLFIFISTYALSSTLIPLLGEASRSCCSTCNPPRPSTTPASTACPTAGR